MQRNLHFSSERFGWKTAQYLFDKAVLFRPLQLGEIRQ